MLHRTWNVNTCRLEAKPDSIMLAFFNVASDPSILASTEDDEPRLVRALTELQATLHPKGTLALPLESTTMNFPHLRREYDLFLF